MHNDPAKNTCKMKQQLFKQNKPPRLQSLSINVLAWLLLLLSNTVLACGAAHQMDKFTQITTARPFTQTQSNSLQIFSLIEPAGVQLTNEGKIIILDSERGQVNISDLKGNALLSFGSIGKAPGLLAAPKGLAVDLNGDIYIADSGNNRIQRFTSEGRFISSWGAYGYGEQELIQPSGIAVDGRYVYVADTGKNRIVVFQKNGEFVRAFGKYGTLDTDFNQPVGLALNARGHLIIADSQNDKIKTFTANGAYVSAWGVRGDLPGQLLTPFGLAWSQGKIYVAEAGGHRIQVFDNEGKFLQQFSTPPEDLPSTDIRLHYPAAIAISPDGKYKIACEPLHIRCRSFDGDTVVSNLIQEDSVRWEKGPGKFFYGSALAIDGDVMALIEPEQHAVALLDISGKKPKFIQVLGSFGSNAGQFKSPSGLAVDAERNRLYVSDAHNHRVQVFDLLRDKKKRLASARFRIALGSYGAGVAEFNEPGKLVKGKNGEIYVLDVLNNRIQVIGEQYASSEVLGIAKDKINMLSSTQSFAIAEQQQHIYLVDNDINKINVLNMKGELIEELGERYVKNRHRQHQTDRFVFPYDIALDEKGFIYASDLADQKIKKFDVSGNHLQDWGSWGSATGEFYKPKSIAIDTGKKRVFVIDFGNYRGQIFDYNGKYQGGFGIGYARLLPVEK